MKLGLQVTVSFLTQVLGTELGSSGKAVSISPAPHTMSSTYILQMAVFTQLVEFQSTGAKWVGLGGRVTFTELFSTPARPSCYAHILGMGF